MNQYACKCDSVESLVGCSCGAFTALEELAKRYTTWKGKREMLDNLRAPDTAASFSALRDSDCAAADLAHELAVALFELEE